MKEQIKQYIATLLMERAHIKQILKNFDGRLSEDDIDFYLESILEIEKLIEKLKKGLE